LDADKFEEIANLEEALILDVRSKEDFAEGHIPGSIFIGLDGSFAPWVGALIPDIKQNILLVTPQGREEETVTRMARVGYDNTLGYIDGGFDTWKNSGKEIDTVVSIDASQFKDRMNVEHDREILDVRKPTEFLSQHVKDAVNLPLDYINSNMDRVDRDGKYYLYCRSGYRSLVAASILKSRGFHNIVDIEGGFAGIEEDGKIPLTEYVCPTTIPQEVIDEALAAVV
jgi:rhodanese-related sulfurtransferase